MRKRKPFKQLEALSLLLRDKKPALRLIQGAVSIDVLYIFEDASGSGYGTSWKEEYAKGFRFGVLNEEGDDTTSNYQEFRS